MININYGHNKELMEACRPISDYSFFIDRIRAYIKKDYTMEQAVDAALEDMPDDSVIKPFLISNRAEVRRMCITEYNEERTLAETREEGYIKGREEGREEGRVEGREEGRVEGLEEGRVEGIEIGKLQMLIDLINKGLLSLTDAADSVNMTVAEFESKAAAYAAG